MAADDPDLLRLPGPVRALVESLPDGPAMVLLIRSHTRVDTGRWFRRPRVWIACFTDRLALAASGPRPVVAVAPFTDLRETQFNHVTGELNLAPAPDLPRRTLRMTPVDGYRILAQIHHEGADHA